MGKAVRKFAIVAAQALVCFFLVQYWTLPTTHGQDCGASCDDNYSGAIGACNTGQTNGTCTATSGCYTQCVDGSQTAYGGCFDTCSDGGCGNPDAGQASCDHRCYIAYDLCIMRANPLTQSAVTACQTTEGSCEVGCVGE
jgi:hypothetical protein